MDAPPHPGPVGRSRPLPGASLALAAALLVLGGADAVAQPPADARITARIDAGWRPASRTFSGTTNFSAFAELGNFEADYEITEGAVVDGGISFLLWRNLAVGLDVSSYRSVNQARLSTEVPHPFFFDLPRTTVGFAGGLVRQELGVHLRALWAIRVADWLIVSVSGGPSLLNGRQDLVSAVQHREVGFPFEDVIFSGHSTTTQSENTLGLNGGVDVDAYVLDRLPGLGRYRVMQRVGVGVLVRWVAGSVDMQVGDAPVSVDLGGVQITTGLRFRF